MSDRGRCKIHDDWLTREDAENNNLKFNEWARKKSDSIVFCIVCRSEIKCDSKGFQAIVQHSKTAVHKKQIKSIDPSQMRLVTLPSASTTTLLSKNSNNNRCVLINSREPAIRAEIIWTLKAVVSNYSANSCEDIANIFRTMFPNEEFLKHFRLGRHKMSYLITDCLGPYFKNLLLDDINNSYYTLCFDETTNSKSKKELQIRVRYYSENSKKVVVHHLETFFIEDGKADTIFKYIRLALDNAKLPISKMLTLGKDGPNVNKKVFRLVNEEFKLHTQKTLINIGIIQYKYLSLFIYTNYFYILQVVATFILCIMLLKQV